MDTEIMEALPLLGICNLCLNEGAVRSMLLAHNASESALEEAEIYTDMLVKCFAIDITKLNYGDIKRLICDSCAEKLHNTVIFRQQVETSLAALEASYKLSCQLQKESRSSVVKVESNHDDPDFDLDMPDNDDDNDEDGASIDLKTEVKIETIENPINPRVILVKLRDDYHHSGSMDADPMDDDDVSDSEVQTKRKSKSPRKKKMTRTKLGAQLKSKVKVEYLNDLKRKMDLQEKMRAEEEITINETPAIQTTPRPKIIDTEMKGFTNTITIVENSFVCPFYTTYSDYYCIYCRKMFTDPHKLREHTMEHDPTTFRDILYMNKKLTQIDVVRVDCRLCPQPIHDVEGLKDHLQTEHGKSLYPIINEFLKFRLTTNSQTCTECGRPFKLFHALKKHMAEHFGTCICDVCGAHYFEQRNLLLHQKKHQNTKVEIHSCGYCDKVFKSRHNRYLHEAKVHKKESTFSCSKCDEVFFSYTLRYRHLIQVHGEERRYPCDPCGRIYDTRKSLRDHNRRSHLKIMKHQCDLCDKRFYRPCTLKEHMSTHTGERNYRCEYCGKSYPRLRGLNVHKQSHSMEKKYRCMLCNVTFTQNGNLKNHMKRQHYSLDIDDSDYKK